MAIYQECEHLRWNAFLFMRGVRKWDISGVEKIKKANDIAAHNRHAALVPFAELPDIDKKSIAESNLQENDKKNIQLIIPVFGRNQSGCSKKN